MKNLRRPSVGTVFRHCLLSRHPLSFLNFGKSNISTIFLSYWFLRSGSLRPPFMHNGFYAQLKFAVFKELKAIKDSTVKPKADSARSNSAEETLHSGEVQHDEAFLTSEKPIDYNERVTRPSHAPSSNIYSSPQKVFTCRDEVSEPILSGKISSAISMQSPEICSIVFRGEQRDLLLIRMNALYLR